MPLDKDVFVVSLGRRDDFNSFPKRNRCVYCKFKAPRRGRQGAVLMPELVTWHREPRHGSAVDKEVAAPFLGPAKIQVVVALGPTKTKTN
jgi:hypothetical protein